MIGYLSLIIFILHCNAIPIDNNVKDFPNVTCGLSGVRVDVDTEKSFQGRVYVKGESDKKDCVKSFASTPAAPIVQLQYAADGGVITGETLFPRGVEYTFTLVVSFHSIFVTKVDKAYRIRCFYMEEEKTVAQQLDVSMLTTQAVNEQFPMPACRYHIRRGGRQGPPVRFAIIGEPVYHVWECDDASLIYGMLVKSCFVDDGQGNKVELINDKGCANDKHLIPNLTYEGNKLETFTESHVFKYADRPSMFFACTLVICFKEDGGCNGITPPDCGPILSPYPQRAVGGEPVSKDVPFLPTETLFPNLTKLESDESEYNSNFTKKQFESWVPLWQHGVRSKHVQKRDVFAKIKRSVVETDISAKPFVVLPFDEHNEENLRTNEIAEPDLSFLNEDINESSTENAKSKGRLFRKENFTYKQNPYSTKSKNFCVSPNWFGMALALLLVLLIFSAFTTVLFTKRLTKIVDNK